MKEFEYRSMELIERIAPEEAEKLLRCFMAGCFVVFDFANINTIEEIDDFLSFADEMTFFTDSPEEYLDYKSVDDALDAFIAGARWLAFYGVKEKLLMFQLLVYAVINEEFGPYIVEFEHYNSKDIEHLRNLIEFFAEWLQIPPSEMNAIASEAFCDVKELWCDSEKLTFDSGHSE